MSKLIVVNKQDKILGYETREKCHRLNGILHRAFSVFIINDKNEILLQKRSKYKPLWPLFWSNTCCSHPRKGETVSEAAKGRLKEEMGFRAKLKFLYKFCYQEKYKDIGSESELCYVLLGKYNGQKIDPDKKEVADCKWMAFNKLKSDIKKNPEIYTPWLKMEIKEIRNYIDSKSG